MAVFRSTFALGSSAAAHFFGLFLIWLNPFPAPQPPPPPPDGSPVSVAAFDWDDAPPESSSPTPAEVATPPDEPPPAQLNVSAPTEALPDPLGINSEPEAPKPAAETGEGEAQADETKKGDTTQNGAKSRNPRPDKKPCPQNVADIEQLGPNEYFVERELVEYYAAHIPEIDNLGSVWTHKDAAGKPDGFRVGLPRCTVLRDGGLRSGDVVKNINGIKINNVLQAVGAYLKLRKEPILYVQIVRKKEPVTLKYHLEKKDRKKKR